MKASSKILSFQKRKATSVEVLHLGMKQMEDVWHIERIRLGDDTPIAIETTIIPWTFAKDLRKKDIQGSLYDYMETKEGLVIGEGKQSIEAVSADKHTAELLDISTGSPILLIERVTPLKNGTPFEYIRSQYVGGRFKFYL
nr:UTRA domain-containing protein [Bacillus sp. FJAT-49736]